MKSALLLRASTCSKYLHKGPKEVVKWKEAWDQIFRTLNAKNTGAWIFFKAIREVFRISVVISEKVIQGRLGGWVS